MAARLRIVVTIAMKVCVDLEPAERTPNDLALQKPGNDQSGGEKPDEGNQSKDRYVVMTDVKQRPLQGASCPRPSVNVS
jgi:hypothetical protein